MALKRVEIDGLMAVDQELLDNIPADLIFVYGTNGSGKSTFAHAVSWALFGKVDLITGVDGIINTSRSDFTKVEVLWENPQTGDQVQITRRRPCRGSTTLTVAVNGTDVSKNTTTQTQEVLFEILGIQDKKRGWLDFLNQNLLSSPENRVFVTDGGGNVASRRDMILRFMYAEEYEDLYKRSVSARKKLQEVVDTTEYNVEQLTHQQSQFLSVKEYESAVLQEKSKIMACKKEIERLNALKEASDLKQRLEYCDQEILCLTEKQQSLQVKLDALEKAEPTPQPTQHLADEMAKIEVEIDEYRNTKHEVQQTGRELQQEIAGFSDPLRCPSCQERLSYHDNTLVLYSGLTSEQQNSLVQQLSANKKDRQSLDQKVEQATKRLAELRARLLQAQLPKRSRDMEVLQTEINNARLLCEDRVSKRQQLALELSSCEDNDETPDEIDKKLLAQKRQVELANQNLGRLRAEKESRALLDIKVNQEQLALVQEQNEVQIAQQWEAFLWVFRDTMIESFLPLLEEKTNFFLRKLGTFLRIEFSTQKKKKGARKGENEFKMDFLLRIFGDNGVAREDLETFSKGERERIGLATSLALRNLSQRMGKSQLDFLIIDEAADALDQEGMSRLLNLLKNEEIQAFVISHRREFSGWFPNQIEVIKSNEFTEYFPSWEEETTQDMEAGRAQCGGNVWNN